MGWLVSQAAKIAGPRVLLGVVAAGIVAVCVLGGLLYWSIKQNGSLAEQRDQAIEAAERNAERAKELLADIERRDQLDAAFRSAIDNIEGRFSGLSKEISAAVEAASEEYLSCRPMPVPDGVYQRLLDGARGSSPAD